ncbi:MAG: NAD-glutamate dehydrogenase [Bowdeniella nasicola]|nr:NAD-glutamate dehydrogenase [Bowdeniella nasicola]
MTRPHLSSHLATAATLLADVADLPPRVDPDTLLTQVVRGIGPDDIVAAQPEELARLCAELLTLARTRDAGEPQMRASDAHSREVARPLLALDIITDDMPYLVDSLSAEIERHGLLIYEIIHPQMRVARKGSTLTDVFSSEHGAPALEESWMRFLIEHPDSAQASEDLRAGLRAVLGDVRRVAEDRTAMRERAIALAGELDSGPQREAEDTRTAARLLRWLADGHFRFLGVRSYRLLDPESDATHVRVQALPGTGLGLLREAGESPVRTLPAPAAAKAREPERLIITKINRPSTVAEPVPLDYIGVKDVDENGLVIGEHRFLGMFTPLASQDSVFDVPVIAPKIESVFESTGIDPEGNLGSYVRSTFESYPRDELFQASADQLAEIAGTVAHLSGRRRTRIFVRRDPYARFASCMIFMPRDRYSRTVRIRLEALVKEAFGGDRVESSAQVSSAPLARLHVVVWSRASELVADVDGDWLAAQISHITHSLDEDVADLLVGHEDAEALGAIVRAMPKEYKDATEPEVALADARLLHDLDEARVRVAGSPSDGWRMRLYAPRAYTLSELLPSLSHVGVRVVDEKWYTVHLGEDTRYVHDLGLETAIADPATFDAAVEAVLAGRCTDDGFNALVVTAGLPWQDIAVLRAIAAYLRQTVSVLSREYMIDTLTSNPELARSLVALFHLRFGLEEGDGQASERRRTDFAAALEDFYAALDGVASLDQDRILRAMATVIAATTRTNAFIPGERALAFKLDPRAIPDMPEPRPRHEIWVYGPRVHGVHLRFGAVARGGLRFSDRKEDFRTEVLGLVKAQMVKNAIIVPTGSKGGFVAPLLPDPSDRDAFRAEGRKAYVQFVSALLDLTDNRVDGEIRHPEHVVRYDEDDPYLVVAADKGTAAFSDTANEVSAAHDFWLGDAFASGGSTGYDHKAMGITARGAWESTKRHFRELGVDTQSEDFTVAGIGDMSGDVFGNGMLLSEHIRLIGAFDHRHVFVDPNPDAARSYAERRRLFEKPGSSWADYDETLISSGGGVFARTAKSVPVTSEMREALGLGEDVTDLTPNQLISSVLKAPVDLLFNGGIGTYVRASDESDDEIGDRANDAIRVAASDLRARVIVEGGNLGVSQRGRIEAARCGVHVNTDAIDNSGGVDSSDQEVNIKILLSPLVASGELSEAERNALLAEMTDDVAAAVLRQNYEQNVLLGNARFQDDRMVGAHVRLMHVLEDSGELDRELEYLPSDEELEERTRSGHGLVSPEFAVLMAYAKISLKNALLETDLPDEPWTNALVRHHFPEVLTARYGDHVDQHPLRREIVVTELANSLINRGGITFVTRAMEESGASADQVARAYVVAREVFNLADFVTRVEALDGRTPTDVQSRMYLTFRRMLDRAVRWFLHNRPAGLSVPDEIDRYRERVAALRAAREQILPAAISRQLRAVARTYTDAGVDEELAALAASLLDQALLLDVIEVAEAFGLDVVVVAQVYFGLAEELRIRDLLDQAGELPQTDRWDALARAAMRGDITATLADITRAVLDSTGTITRGAEGSPSGVERLAAWLDAYAGPLERVQSSLSEVYDAQEPALAPLSVAVRQLRSLIRTREVSNRP